jgi:hypothetical protein
MRARGNFSAFKLGMVLAAASVLAACTKGGQFDPTTLLDNDMFDNKKPLPGQREPVFPGGVPGITSGIPADLYKGYQPPPEQAADSGDTASDGAATNIVPAAEGPPKAEARLESKPKPKPKRKFARAPATPRTEISVGLARRPKPATQQAEQSSQTAWPAPPSTGQTQSPQGGWPAPPAAAQPAQTAWPAPPSTAAAQQSQSVWPAPPPTQ